MTVVTDSVHTQTKALTSADSGKVISAGETVIMWSKSKRQINHNVIRMMDLTFSGNVSVYIGLLLNSGPIRRTISADMMLKIFHSAQDPHCIRLFIDECTQALIRISNTIFDHCRNYSILRSQCKSHVQIFSYRSFFEYKPLELAKI